MLTLPFLIINISGNITKQWKGSLAVPSQTLRCGTGAPSEAENKSFSALAEGHRSMLTTKYSLYLHCL